MFAESGHLLSLFVSFLAFKLIAVLWGSIAEIMEGI